jgi:hypothetical protein
LLLAAGAAIAAALVLNRPRAAWLVEAGLEQQWEELLEGAAAPPPFKRVIAYDPAVALRKGQTGVIISKNFPVDEGGGATADAMDVTEAAWEPPIRVFPGLYQDRGDYRGAIPLALDPWLVFRKTSDPQLSLARVLNNAGGGGTLILPGAEPDAVHAWVTQFVQHSPGDFSTDKQGWDAAEQGLVYGNRRFQQGALTYAWLDAWLRLLGDETAWIYAPLSRTYSLSAYDFGRLDATVFPIPADWHTYGLQAEVLWAIPVASEQQEANIGEAKTWLASPETQGIIADMLGWIPAQGGSVPRDTIAREAQVAWYSSSFVWQPLTP